MSDTMTVGKKLVELCKAGKATEAINTLYSPHIVSIEAVGGGPDHPARMEGIEAVKGKSDWWQANHEVHSAHIEGPYPNGDRFIAHFKYNVTAKGGPMAGKTFDLDETGLYTVEDGKVTMEEFFYNMGA